MEFESQIYADLYGDNVRNYSRLKETMDQIPTMDDMEDPDWMYVHRAHILAYRLVFKDLRKLRPEITDMRFRSLASETEQILQHLCQQIEKLDWFDISWYYNLNANLVKLGEYDMESDDLVDMINDMSM